MRRAVSSWLALCLLLPLAACPAPREGDPVARPDAGTAPAAGSRAQAPTVVPRPVKQLVLIYTGDTLSGLQTVVDNDEAGRPLRRGGLSALTGAIIDYQRSITAMTRLRVAESGGNVDKVRADAGQGLLGEHPYLLLDYGGWERDGDPKGAPYVALQLRMYRDLKYAAVGTKLYERLLPAVWRSYAGQPNLEVLVNSAGPPRTAALPALPLVTRQIHGALWGVASVPLPSADAADPFQAIEEYVEAAAGQLEHAGCKYRILLCAGGPKQLYEKLRGDKRFTVVIGASPPGLTEAPGTGELPADGPLMLPELNWGGQEFGTCHLIYPEAGDAPTQFNFALHSVVDDLKTPHPYRKQVAATIRERQASVEALPFGKS